MSTTLDHRPERASAAEDRPDWLDYEEYPFTSRFVEVDGNRVHYVDEGTGPTLLFVHAGPAWSFVFRDVIEALRPDYRCLALDFPGTGPSIAADRYTPSIEDASWVLEAFIDRLGLERPTAVVHDVGGPVTFGVAARQPDRFVGFGIMGSFGWSLNREFPDVARFIRIVDGRAFGLVNTNLNLLIRLTATKYGVGRRLSKPGRCVFKAPYASRRKRKNGVAMLGSALRSDDYLAEVREALQTDLSELPVLLAFGENDDSRKAGFQDRWEAFFPHAWSRVVDGANHFPMADAPHFVAETIDAWHADEIGSDPAG